MKSPLTITLNNSKDFIKLTLVLYVLSSIVLFNADAAAYIKIILWFLLGGVAISNFFSQKPHHSLLHLSFDGCKWLLYDICGAVMRYDSLMISLYGNFFMLLAFYVNGKKCKLIVVCNDQLTPDERRHLVIMASKKPLAKSITYAKI